MGAGFECDNQDLSLHAMLSDGGRSLSRRRLGEGF